MNRSELNVEPSDVSSPDKRPDEKRRAKAPLFTALFTVPFSTVAAILFLAFSLATLVGGLLGLGGLVYAVAAPFFAGRLGTNAVFIQVGAGLAVSGLGLIVFSAFLLLTRSSATLSLRLLRYVQGR